MIKIVQLQCKYVMSIFKFLSNSVNVFFKIKKFQKEENEISLTIYAILYFIIYNKKVRLLETVTRFVIFIAAITIFMMFYFY